MSAMAWQTPRLAPAWRWPTVAVLALIALLLVSYRSTGLGMVEIWSRSETFTHAFIVPPIALWLIWRQRAVLQNLQPRPAVWMVIPLGLLSALWWVGNEVTVNAATQLALTAMLVAIVPTLLGWQVTRALIFPLAFLFFAVPIGEFLTPWLMRYTADFTVAALRITGVPVYREGQMLVIPTGRWSVIEACSGVRYLMASVMVGSLFAYLNYRSTRRRIIFGILSFVVPIVANWLRAYMIVMLGHLSNNRIATGVDHLVYGWVFFGVVILALFFIGARWSEPDAPEPAPLPASSQPASPRLAWQTAAVAVVALGVLQWPMLLPRERVPELAASAPLKLPDALGAWRAEAAPMTEWAPIFVAATQELSGRYDSPQGRVGVHIAHYPRQTEAAKLVSSVNMLVRSQDPQWHQLSSGQRVAKSGSHTLRWQTAELAGLNQRADGSRELLTVWQVYHIAGHLTASPIEAKLWQAWLRVRGLPDDSAALILYANLAEPEAADRVLAAFVDANFDQLVRIFAPGRATP